MAVAWLLTLTALAGVFGGAHLVRAEKFSEQLTSAGGGLLFGISIFWLLPEISEGSGKVAATLAVLGVAGLLLLLDLGLSHGGRPARPGLLWPILAATAVHSFLDGWSVRALAPHPFANATVAAGLALHKVPEGVALGWMSRRSLESARKAIAAGTGAEVFTLLGAFVQPALNASGAQYFGVWWTGAILAIIAGGFFFLGCHAVIPNWKHRGAMVVFIATVLLVGALRFFRAVGV